MREDSTENGGLEAVAREDRRARVGGADSVAEDTKELTAGAKLLRGGVLGGQGAGGELGFGDEDGQLTGVGVEAEAVAVGGLGGEVG